MRPPVELLARLRWFFLAFTWFFLLTFLPQVLLRSSRPWSVRGLTGVAMVSLALWWWRCYRRRCFPAGGLVLEAAAFAGCVLTPTDPFRALGLLYIAVNFRALYGSARQVATFTVLATSIFGSSVLLAAHLGSTNRSALLATTLPGVPVLALIAHLVAVASERAVRAAARERLLSRAGLAIAAAPDAAHVRQHALSAIGDLLADVPGATARLVYLQDLDQDLDQGQDRDPAVAASPTGPGGPGSRLVLPLRTAAGSCGTLLVDSAHPLPPEVRDALSVLTAQLALALAATALTEDLSRRARQDPLTGLANRAHVHDRLHQSLVTESAPGRVAVLLLDLDGFKAVNDTLGHAGGDALLTVVAQRLREQVRPGDVVARLGGDEFTVVLPGLLRPADALVIADRALSAVCAPVHVEGRTVRVGVSIGVAWNDSGAQVDRLLAEADRAMYRAKRDGKNRVAATLPPASDPEAAAEAR